MCAGGIAVAVSSIPSIPSSGHTVWWTEGKEAVKQSTVLSLPFWGDDEGRGDVLKEMIAWLGVVGGPTPPAAVETRPTALALLLCVCTQERLIHSIRHDGPLSFPATTTLQQEEKDRHIFLTLLYPHVAFRTGHPPLTTPCVHVTMPSMKDFDAKKFGGIPLDSYKPVPGLTLKSTSLSAEQKQQLQYNINLMRDSIVFFTATGAARGVSGHTGGPFDMVPEAAILLSLFENEKNSFVPTLFDEAGHRSALVYLRCALDGHLKAEDLLK